MHIGLIGGIGPAATDFYYRRLIRHAAEKQRDLELTIVHADTPTLLRNLSDGNHVEQVAIYDRLTRRLVGAGADCVVVTSIAGHFCIDAFAATSQLPVVDITEVLSDWLGRARMRRVGILGTMTVMASGMYGKLAPVEVLSPVGDALEEVHGAYITLAQSGIPTTGLETVFLNAGHALMDRGAEAVLLGGTDLNAIFAGERHPFPIVDCAGIHIDEVATRI